MQQPLEDRIASIETAAERHNQTILRLTAIADHQDQLLDRLVANQDTLQASQLILQANQDRLQANQEAMQTNLEAMQANLYALQAGQDRFQTTQETIITLLEELTDLTAATHRLWLRLAQRYGWLDDEQDSTAPGAPT